MDDVPLCFTSNQYWKIAIRWDLGLHWFQHNGKHVYLWSIGSSLIQTTSNGEFVPKTVRIQGHIFQLSLTILYPGDSCNSWSHRTWHHGTVWSGFCSKNETDFFHAITPKLFKMEPNAGPNWTHTTPWDCKHGIWKVGENLSATCKAGLKANFSPICFFFCVPPGKMNLLVLRAEWKTCPRKRVGGHPLVIKCGN